MTPWTVAYQAPPSMGFPRQEYWSGVPLPSLLMCPVVNGAVMNIRVHASLSVIVFSGCMPSNGIVGSYCSFIPSFFKEFPYSCT